MRNLSLLLSDGNLDPFSFWKAFLFENAGHFVVFLVSVSGLNFAMNFFSIK